jgi:hypothetical protein
MYTLGVLLLTIVGLANSISGCVIYELDHTTLWCGQGFINPGSKESERALDIEIVSLRLFFYCLERAQVSW